VSHPGIGTGRDDILAGFDFDDTRGVAIFSQRQENDPEANNDKNVSE
jgi:hypothetical protein